MKGVRVLYCLIALVLAGSILSGCNRTQVSQVTEPAKPTAYELIQKYLIGMSSYQSEATVEYISNKTRNSYETLQQCRITGEYRVEVLAPERAAGNVTLSDGSLICQFNKRLGSKVAVGSKETKDRSEIFVTSFVKNYVNSEEVSVSVGSFGKGRCTVLEAVIPGDHPYLATEKLWVDNETMKPVKLIVYDPDGGERIVVTYKTFEYNVELEDTLFKAVS